MFSIEAAGYNAHGNRYHFRDVRAEAVLPSTATMIYNSEGLAVHLQARKTVAVLGISTTRGSNNWNAAFALETLTPAGPVYDCMNDNSPVMSTGDHVTLQAYQNTRTGLISYSVTDDTAGLAFAGRCRPAALVPTTAFAGLEFGVNPWTPGMGYLPPGAPRYLAGFHQVRVTSYNGTRGGLTGTRWPLQRSIVTTTGTAGGLLIAYPRQTGTDSFSVTAAKG